jgi:hypothetical protein
MLVNLSEVAAGGAHAPPGPEGSRIRKIQSLDRGKGIIARRTETRGLLRLPVRVERPRDVFSPSVLSIRWIPGRRILLNAIPAKGLSASTSDRPEEAECNAPPT